MPSAWAWVTSARALILQSTVMSSFTPASASSPTAAVETPNPAEAVRKPPAHVGAEFRQHADQQEGGGDAVGVVVAVDGDGLPPAQRQVDAPPRLGHAVHEVRVVDAEVGVQEGARHGQIVEPAAHQHLGEDVAHAELFGEQPNVGERGGRDAPGAWIGHECITPRV